MLCSKCGNEIIDISSYCSNCGNKIEIEDDYTRLRREALENEPPPLYKTKIYWFLLLFLIGTYFIIENKRNSKSINSNENVINCKGAGNNGCIDRVRYNFTSSGKQILSELYLGDGVFKITGLDPKRGVTFNSTVFTDCNCQLTNVKINEVQ
jgi:hypothetical protein